MADRKARGRTCASLSAMVVNESKMRLGLRKRLWKCRGGWGVGCGRGALNGERSLRLDFEHWGRRGCGTLTAEPLLSVGRANKDPDAYSSP